MEIRLQKEREQLHLPIVQVPLLVKVPGYLLLKIDTEALQGRTSEIGLFAFRLRLPRLPLRSFLSLYKFCVQFGVRALSENAT